MTAAVQCEGLTFQYLAGVHALDGVDLEVGEGTIHGILGPNGSGKTTLVNVISGFSRPQRGTVRVRGADLTRQGAGARAAAGVRRSFQRAALVDELTCLENCVVGAWRNLRRPGLHAPLYLLSPGARRERRAVEERARAALRWAGVDERWDGRPVAETPQAVHQLLQLAVARMGEPELLILDEPGAGLTQSELDTLARRLAALRADGLTVLLIEHHVRFVLGICDRITVLSAGRVIADGPPAEIREHPVVREVYLG